MVLTSFTLSKYAEWCSVLNVLHAITEAASKRSLIHAQSVCGYELGRQKQVLAKDQT